ncbi:hypothetical protein [Anabaena sp. PCC 7108]|uniref:hypothetical protein n=1 Tax=Anabaena sp. PCC 7108 TaxID=163908 RepID=UPI00036C0550|nr:hypothetical protein [Anabaena sp. PCC 7108]
MYSWLTAEHLENTTSEAIKNSIASYLHNLVAQQPIFLQLLQILGWVVNHPIISVVVLLFLIAILWSVIKGIVHLIETASWSIAKLPLKLIQSLIKVSFFTVKTITDNSNNSKLISANSRKINQDKQQRLTEISHRLETIQKEQQQLLQEATEIINSQTIDIKIEELQLNHIIANSSDSEITG